MQKQMFGRIRCTCLVWLFKACFPNEIVIRFVIDKQRSGFGSIKDSVITATNVKFLNNKNMFGATRACLVTFRSTFAERQIPLAPVWFTKKEIETLEKNSLFVEMHNQCLFWNEKKIKLIFNWLLTVSHIM